MSILEAIIFGLVQGLSEFLPISSSGHLVLAKELMNIHEPGIVFEIFVHFGTVLSILVAFREDVIKLISGFFQTYKYGDPNFSPEIKEYTKLSWFIILGSIPAGLIGFTLKDQIEALFTSGVGFSGVYLVSIMLIITGMILFLTRYARDLNKKIKWKTSLIIGIAQAFAILPGISRSGSTIATGLFFGIEKEKAAKFSFLLSLPVILGATLKQFLDLWQENAFNSELLLPLTIATVTAFISGYFAIIILLDIVRRGKLEYFAYYCWTVGILAFLYVL